MLILAKFEDIVQYDHTNKLEKDLENLPDYILEKLKLWAIDVNKNGMREARKNKGYYDEPLKGKRKRQRSIRLNKSYRAIYVEDKEKIKILVIEVNKHDY